MPGRYRVDWGHLAFVAVIAAAVVWYLCDAMSVSMSVNNLLFIVPVGVFAVLLCCAIVPQCFHRVGQVAPQQRRTKDITGMQELTVNSRKEALQIGLLAASLGALVFLLDVIGFDISLWLFAIAVMLHLRRTAPADAGAVSTGACRACCRRLPGDVALSDVHARAVGAPSRARSERTGIGRAYPRVLGWMLGMDPAWVGDRTGGFGDAWRRDQRHDGGGAAADLADGPDAVAGIPDICLYGRRVRRLGAGDPHEHSRHAGVLCNHVRRISDDAEGRAQRGAGLRAVLLDAVLHRGLPAVAVVGRTDGAPGHQGRAAGDAGRRAVGPGTARIVG